MADEKSDQIIKMLVLCGGCVGCFAILAAFMHILSLCLTFFGAAGACPVYQSFIELAFYGFIAQFVYMCVTNCISVAVANVIADQPESVGRMQASIAGIFQIVPLIFNVYLGIAAMGINEWLSSGCSFFWNYVVIVYVLGLFLLGLFIALACCVLLIAIGGRVMTKDDDGSPNENKRLVNKGADEDGDSLELD